MSLFKKRKPFWILDRIEQEITEEGLWGWRQKPLIKPTVLISDITFEFFFLYITAQSTSRVLYCNHSSVKHDTPSLSLHASQSDPVLRSKSQKNQSGKWSLKMSISKPTTVHIHTHSLEVNDLFFLINSFYLDTWLAESFSDSTFLVEKLRSKTHLPYISVWVWSNSNRFENHLEISFLLGCLACFGSIIPSNTPERPADVSSLLHINSCSKLDAWRLKRCLQAPLDLSIRNNNTFVSWAAVLL